VNKLNLSNITEVIELECMLWISCLSYFKRMEWGSRSMHVKYRWGRWKKYTNRKTEKYINIPSSQNYGHH
jgi:hypothetical protein